MTRPAASAPPPRRRVRWTLGALLLSLAIVAVLGAWSWRRLGPGAGEDLVPELTGARAEIAARSVGVAFAEAQEGWRRTFRDRLGRDYRSAEPVLFARTAVAECSGGEPVAGPFYCRPSRQAGFDLLFIEALSQRLRREAELGTALVAARVAAIHVQGELGVLDAAEARRRSAGRRARAALDLGLALQADCLAGVWAGAAGGRLGPIPAGFYGELVRIARNVTADLAQTGPETPAALDPFRRGRPEERDAAFAGGYAARDPAACPAPDLGAAAG